MAVGGTGHSSAMEEAFVSLTTNNEYGIGAYVLGKSLRRTNTTKKLVLLVTNGVSASCKKLLSEVWDDLIDVTVIEGMDTENLALLSRPELGITFTKLRVWSLTQFSKCVFLDADTLVMQNIDDLFDREELSAAPDIGWPDCFNTGVFVFRPSLETYDSLLDFAKTHGSFDGGDQGLLNDYFNWWSTRDIKYHLPFVYNMVSNVCYSYAPAYKRFGSDVKIVHFLGSIKPWQHYFNTETRQVRMVDGARYTGADQQFIQQWWDSYVDGESTFVLPGDAMQGARGLSGESPQWVTGTKWSWEKGMIDYTGQDSFERILDHINNMISTT